MSVPVAVIAIEGQNPALGSVLSWANVGKGIDTIGGLTNIAGGVVGIHTSTKLANAQISNLKATGDINREMGKANADMIRAQAKNVETSEERIKKAEIEARANIEAIKAQALAQLNLQDKKGEQATTALYVAGAVVVAVAFFALIIKGKKQKK